MPKTIKLLLTTLSLFITSLVAPQTAQTEPLCFETKTSATSTDKVAKTPATKKFFSTLQKEIRAVAKKVPQELNKDLKK